MTLSADYIKYPLRRHGMDHDLYGWSNLFERPPVKWPGGARVALCVSPTIEWFPINMGAEPFVPPGGMGRPYPDFWDYTYRDYGNRVGIYRYLEIFDELGIKASPAVNSAIADRHPSLIQEFVRRNWEVVASGVDMGHLHYGGMDKAEEKLLVQQSLSTLRKVSGQPVTGWSSPASSASWNTLDLIAAEGVQYTCDWANDDLPFEITAPGGAGLYGMPRGSELSDRQILLTYHHSTQEFAGQILEQFKALYNEASDSGRVMTLTLHPWITGQPHRVKALKSALGQIVNHEEVWVATFSEVLEAFKKGRS